MSNPCVLTLADDTLKHSKLRIRIEDNVGESIHIHFGDIRVDLTIKEFLDLVDDILCSLESLNQVDSFSIRNMDPVFLASISSFLPDLQKVEYEEMKLSELKVVSKGILGLPHICGLSQSRVYRALKGDTQEQINYKQENMRGQSNIDRMNNVMETMSSEKYGKNGQLIVLFNDLNLIRDGQHRAACLYYINPDNTVKVMRMRFKNSKYNSSIHPAFDMLFLWDKQRIKKVLRLINKRQKTIKHQMVRKIMRIRACILELIWR